MATNMFSSRQRSFSSSWCTISKELTRGQCGFDRKETATSTLRFVQARMPDWTGGPVCVMLSRSSGRAGTKGALTIRKVGLMPKSLTRCCCGGFVIGEIGGELQTNKSKSTSEKKKRRAAIRVGAGVFLIFLFFSIFVVACFPIFLYFFEFVLLGVFFSDCLILFQKIHVLIFLILSISLILGDFRTRRCGVHRKRAHKHEANNATDIGTILEGPWARSSPRFRIHDVG